MTPQEYVDIELKLIGRVFEERKVVHPMVVLVKGDNRTIVQPVEFHSDAHKDMLSQGVKDLVKKSEPDIVIYMAEAWAVVMKEYDPSVRASEHPDRIEVVVARIEFKTGEKYQCQAKIVRNKGTPHLDKFEIFPGGMDMGRFTDFFPVGKTN